MHAHGWYDFSTQMNHLQERIGSYLTNRERRQALCLLTIFALLFGASLYSAIIDVINDYSPVYTGITFLVAIGCFLAFVTTAVLMRWFNHKMGTVLSWIGGCLRRVCCVLPSRRFPRKRIPALLFAWFHHGGDHPF